MVYVCVIYVCIMCIFIFYSFCKTLTKIITRHIIMSCYLDRRTETCSMLHRRLNTGLQREYGVLGALTVSVFVNVELLKHPSTDSFQAKCE